MPRRRSTLVTALPALAAAAAVALGVTPAVAEERGPIQIDLSKTTRNPDGTWTMPSPIKEAPDGSLEFSNGTKLTRKQAMERLIGAGNARGPDGRPIRPGDVTINDDGSVVRNSDGAAVSAPATGSGPALQVQPVAPGAGGRRDAEVAATAGEDEPGADAIGPGPTAPARAARPRAAVGGIHMIAGGRGRDGVAATAEIPVLE